MERACYRVLELELALILEKALYKQLFVNIKAAFKVVAN